MLSDDVKITFLNASELTWEIALNNFVEMGNGNLLSLFGNCYLTLNELMHVGELLQDTTALSFGSVSLPTRPIYKPKFISKVYIQ